MTVVMVWVHEYQCIMKKAPRFRSRDGRSNCNGESGAKEPQKDIGKSAREWHFDLEGKDKRRYE